MFQEVLYRTGPQATLMETERGERRSYKNIYTVLLYSKTLQGQGRCYTSLEAAAAGEFWSELSKPFSTRLE